MIYIVFENTVYLNVNADADAEISKALFYLFLMTFFQVVNSQVEKGRVC